MFSHTFFCLPFCMICKVAQTRGHHNGYIIKQHVTSPWKSTNGVLRRSRNNSPGHRPTACESIYIRYCNSLTRYLYARSGRLWGTSDAIFQYAASASSSPGVRRGFWDCLTSPFLPFRWLSFFHHFFDTFLDRFFFDFRSQLASQNPPKSLKNRCQDAFPCWTPFLIDFCFQLGPSEPNLELAGKRLVDFSALVATST